MLQHSEKIEALAAALLEAKKHFKKLRRNKSNPYFKARYADLDACLDSTKDALAAQGLVVIQGLGASADGDPLVTTMLVHAPSGQWIYSVSMSQAKDRLPQTIGAAATYLRRYGYSAIVGITPDDDDDAESAMPRGTAQKVGQKFSGQIQPQQYPPLEAPRPGVPKPQGAYSPHTPDPRQTSIPGTKT